MLDKALIIAAVNPFHEGHEYLLSKTQEFSKSTDIYVGGRQIKHRLPRNITAKSVEKFIKENNWENKFNIIAYGKRANLNYNQYSLFAAGSDILNLVANKTLGTPNFPFPNVLSIHREEMPLKEDSRIKLMKYVNLIEIPGFSNISGSKIRQSYREGKDISQMVSETTWEIIKDHVHIFKD